MKVKKMFSKIIVTGICILTSMLIATNVKATTQTSIVLGLEEFRSSGLAYMTEERIAWKISSYDSLTSTTPDQTKTIYCIKGGPGFGSSQMGNGTVIKRTYLNVGNLKNYQEIESPYREVLPTGENYNSLVWVLDHCYVPAKNNQEIDMANAYRQKLLSDADKYIKETRNYDAHIQNSGISDDEIDIAQQLAVWYFTNNDSYKITNESFSLWVKSIEDTEYVALGDKFVDGDNRNDAAIDLFIYLVDGGLANKDVAPTTTSQNTITIVDVNAAAEKVAVNQYIVGPYKLETDATDYTLKGSLKSSVGTELTYTILDANKQATAKTLKELELANEEFYLSVSTTESIKDSTFTVTMTEYETELTYWSVAGANPVDQPVVEIERTDKETEAITTIREKIFDLALRKYITKVDGVTLTNTRVPNIDTSKIKTDNMAEYKHRKDAVAVKNGSKIIYNITVYNEGEQAGYATKIIDQLPEGLKFTKVVSGNYEVEEYDETLNKVTFVRKTGFDALNAYDGENLASETIEIECEVIALPDNENSKILTNVAYIWESYNSVSGETITNQVGKDIDSEPATKPNVNKDNMDNYKGNSSNKEDLTDSDYFYKGEQDDDDFEKVVVLPEQLDMALRKYILKVNGNDVAVSRVPVISDKTIADLREGTVQTVTKEHTKSPVRVEIGDTVLYEIRVYNEGTADGYVKEITDYLPEGLTLKENSTINETYGWTNPSGDGRTIVSTKTKDQLLKAFDGTTIESAYVQVECIVTAEASQNAQSLKNIAEITEQVDKYGNTSEDRDSTPNNLTDEQKQNYNPGESEKGWGYEDDDDYEIIVIPAKEFDLALRKFVTNINGKELVDSNGKYLREPTIDVSKLVSDANVTTADYKHQKDPVGARIGDIVIYTIRIYNEGDLAGYASKVTDYLPPELEFVMDDEENFNASYGWVVDSTLRKASSTKLAKDEVDPEENLIKAFDKNTMTEPDYVELKIKCRVKSTVKLYDVITNIAEVTECTDAKGNIINDRDSTVDNVVLPTDENLPDYKGNTSNKSILNDKNYHYKGQEDDDDFEKLVIEEFDLALRKFITGVNDEPVTNRVPVFTKTIDENGNYIYEHTKDPIEVETTDVVEYTIRIYNEGNIAGYAKEIKDNIPSGLEFLPENTLNKEYRWKMLDKDGNITDDVSKAVSIVTDYLSKEQEKTSGENLLQAFNQDTMVSPDYKDVKVKFKVIAPNTYEGVITNIAEISDDSDENGNEIKDIDSTPDNNDFTEDDIDVEHVKLTYFDLALRKFITAVNEEEVTDRYPVFKINENGEYVYEHTKEPVEVVNGNIVTYTIRVYNEGKKAGYAKEVKDNLPEGLEFLPENDLNKEYRWVMLDENDDVTEDVSKAVSIVTDYLSKAQEVETGRNNLLKAFDKNTMEEPDYRDVKVAFKVTEPNTSDRIIINEAQISDDSDKDGKDVVDKDSTPNKWIEDEDDQDIEKIRVKYFDLALRKWVSQAIIIQDGKENIVDTGHTAEDDPEEVVKVEIVESKLSKVVVKFKYKIRVTNEGEIPGYVDEISDYIPEGLRFVKADNENWEEVDGKVVTDMLKGTLLNPGESAEVEIILTWINGKDNLGLKINVAEISKDRNDSDSQDIDSTPNNKVDGEDDIDDAPVILTIKTGAGIDSTYIILVAGAILVISLGAIFIKKYVL